MNPYTLDITVNLSGTRRYPAPKKQALTPQQKVDTNPPTILRGEPDTSIWLTRYETSALLGCSPSTLLNYERRGALHPQVALRPDPQGILRRTTVYHPEELTKIRARLRRPVREPKELSARAFDLFREGLKLEAIVSELRTTPEEVERLHEKWLDLGGSRLVIAGPAKEALAKIVGPFDSVTELVELVTKLKPLPEPSAET